VIFNTLVLKTLEKCLIAKNY